MWHFPRWLADADRIRQSLAGKPVTDSAELLGDFGGCSARTRRGQAVEVAFALAACRLGLLAGTSCLATASPALAQITQEGYVTNFDNSSTVSVIDTATNAVGSTVVVGAGSNPFGVAVTSDGRYAYVANFFGNTVSQIDTVSHVVVSTISVGSEPSGVAVTPDGRHAYVTNENAGTVSEIDTATHVVVSTIPVGSGPEGVAVTPDGRHAYVANHNDNTLSVIDTATRAVVSTISVGIGPYGVAVTPDGRQAYVTNQGDGTVSEIDTATHTVVSTISVGIGPFGVAVTSDGRHAYVANANAGTVLEIDTVTHAVVSTISVGSAPSGVAVTPDGRHVYVANQGDGTVSEIDTATHAVVKSIVGFNTPIAFGNFLSPNLITGTLAVASEAALTRLGFGQFVVFKGGTLQTTVGLKDARTLSLLAPGGTLDTNGFDSVFSGTILGTGVLTKTGAGTLTLQRTNAYTGGTMISGGTLSVASDASLGIASGALTLAGGELLTIGAIFSSSRLLTLNAGGTNTLAAATGTTANYRGIISGTGSLSVGDAAHTGTITLTGTNAYRGGTTISGGTLRVASDANLGNAAGAIRLDGGELLASGGFNTSRPLVLTFHNGTLAAAARSSAAFTGNLTGSGSLTVGDAVNTGTVDLGGPNSYRGSTTIVSGATLRALSTGALSPASAFIVNGTLSLNGNSNEIGSLAGTGTVTDGGAAGAVLTAGGDNTSTTFSGVLQDGTHSLALTKTGTGTLTLSGTNTYTGGAVLNAGTLTVAGPQALGFGNVAVNGGILGAEQQSINVVGNYAQNAGGTLQLNIAGRVPGQFDVLNVGGNASLNGTLRLINLGYQPSNGDQLRLVNATGVVFDKFSTFVNPFSLAAGFNTIELVYAKNSVTLQFLTLNTPVVSPPPGTPVPPGTPGTPGAPVVITITDFPSFARTANQSAVAKQLNSLQLQPKDPKLIDFLQNEVFANLPGDFDKISPESLTALYEISFSAANIQASNLEGRFAEIRNGSTGFSSSLNVTNTPQAIVEGKDGKAIMVSGKSVMTPSPENRWGVWISGSGDYVNVGGDDNASGYDFTTGGVTLGLDYRLTRNLALGVALGYAHTWTKLTGDGDIGANSGRAGLYATYYQSGFYLNGYVGGGYNSYCTRRAALGGTATGSTDGGEFDGYVGAGYEFHCGGITFGPIAALQYTYVDISGNTESGSLAPLQINSKSTDSLRTNLGVSASCTARVGKVKLTPSLRATWQHEYLYSALPITAQFAGGAGNAFTVTGPAEGHDGALINAGINVQWTPTIGTYFGYNGQVGRNRYDSQGGVCSVHFDF